jgi:hypothetical protein
MFSAGFDLKDLYKIWNIVPSGMNFIAELHSDECHKFPTEDDYEENGAWYEKIWNKIVGNRGYDVFLEFRSEKDDQGNDGYLEISHLKSYFFEITKTYFKPDLNIGNIIPVISYKGFGGSRSGMRIPFSMQMPSSEPPECN